MATAPTTAEPIAYRVLDAVKVSGISRGRLYEEIAAGRIRAVKNGTRTLVLADSLRDYIRSLPACELVDGGPHAA